LDAGNDTNVPVELRAFRQRRLENPWNERTSFTHEAAGRRTLKKLANGTRAFHIPGIFGNPWDV